MAKEKTYKLPYFKFEVADWMTGGIVFESLEAQGYFINLCAYYWKEKGKVTAEDAIKRYNRPDLFQQLANRFFSLSDGFIVIKFLDGQLLERGHQSIVNSKNGSLGGRPKTQATKPTAKRNESETKAKKSNIEKNKNKNIYIPTVDEVVLYFTENGYSAQAARKAHEHYQLGNWHDTNGKPVMAWKQKMHTNWFKPENKRQDATKQKEIIW